MVKVPNCSLEVSEFKLHSLYYVHLRLNIIGKDMNHLSPNIKLNHRSHSRKNDMPLNKETKLNQYYNFQSYLTHIWDPNRY